MGIRTVFRWLGWLLLLATAIVTLSPHEIRPSTEAPADLERLAAFMLIGGAFVVGYPKHRLPILLLVTGITGALEAGQNLIPGRHGLVHDGGIKVAGAVLGMAIVMLIEHMRKA